MKPTDFYPSEFYNLMLTVKNGLPNGSAIGCVAISKKDAKAHKLAWRFVENVVFVLGLTMVRQGNLGYLITK